LEVRIYSTQRSRLSAVLIFCDSSAGTEADIYLQLKLITKAEIYSVSRNKSWLAMWRPGYIC